MAETEKIPLGVWIDTPHGKKLVYYPGWLFVVALALNGNKWAMDKMEDPEFKKMIRVDIKQRADKQVDKQIEWHLDQIRMLKEKLHHD